jgi:hypothetical protein
MTTQSGCLKFVKEVKDQEAKIKMSKLRRQKIESILIVTLFICEFAKNYTNTLMQKSRGECQLCTASADFLDTRGGEGMPICLACTLCLSRGRVFRNLWILHPAWTSN